jgi:ABC-type sugar transport system substrate-binding protein
MDAAVHNRLEAGGYEVITISCEANAAQQVSDIENLITMNCEAIFFFAVDPNALTDVLKKGRKAGIKMYGIACTIDDLEAYDKIINTDQYASGVGAAEMAASWVDATFPDAADGSIETALIVNTSTVDSNKRSDGERTVAELSPKIKVVAEYDLAGASDSNIKAQEYAEIMQSQYPNLKCVVTYGTDASLGINEAFMRNAGLNRSEFAVFGVDTNEVIYKGIKSSITDESLIRGTVSLGDDLSIDVWECLIDADLEYMDESRSIFKPVKLITTENIGNYVS